MTALRLFSELAHKRHSTRTAHAAREFNIMRLGMKQDEIEKLIEIFNSISCLVAECPEFMRSGDIYERVGKEACKGYAIVKKHSQ